MLSFVGDGTFGDRDRAETAHFAKRPMPMPCRTKQSRHATRFKLRPRCGQPEFGRLRHDGLLGHQSATAPAAREGTTERGRDAREAIRAIAGLDAVRLRLPRPRPQSMGHRPAECTPRALRRPHRNSAVPGGHRAHRVLPRKRLPGSAASHGRTPIGPCMISNMQSSCACATGVIEILDLPGLQAYSRKS